MVIKHYLIPQNCGAYPNPRPEFPTSNIVVFLCAVTLCEVISRFVDICGFVDHNCVNCGHYFPV
jgi:hypothetical protein